MSEQQEDGGQQGEFLKRVTDVNLDSKTAIEIYKDWAGTYDQIESTLEYYPPKIGARHLARVLGDHQGARILDVAAGTGLVAVTLREMGFTNLDAIDGSQEMLNVARTKNLYNNYICAMIGASKIIEIDDDTYDGLVCVGGFLQGHLSHKCFPALLRATKPGGFIVIGVYQKRLSEWDELKDLEPTMKQFEADGKWKWLERVVDPTYFRGDNGIIYIFQKL